MCPLRSSAPLTVPYLQLYQVEFHSRGDNALTERVIEAFKKVIIGLNQFMPAVKP